METTALATEYAPVFLVNAFGAVAASALTTYFWRHRDDVAGGRFLFVSGLASAVWAGAYALSMAAGDLESTLLWHRVRYFGNPFGALAWFLFATVYAGYGRHLTRRRLTALVAVEAVSVAALWTNATPFAPGFHTLWYRQLDLVSTLGVSVVAPEPGPLYWAYTAFNGTLFLLAGGLLFGAAAAPERRLHRRQNVALLVGSFIPFLANVVFKLVGEPLDPTPTALSVTMLTSAYVLSGRGVFDIAPVARSRVVESLDVGVVVFDGRGRIVDANGVANAVLGGDSLVGRDLGTVLSDAGVPWRPPAAAGPRPTDFEVTDRRTGRVYEARRSRLEDGGAAYETLLLYDVTARRERERRLADQNERLESFAGIVSHDLRNPLAVATGYLDLSRTDRDDPNLDRVANALDRMDRLVDDLLSLSQRGRVIDDVRPVSLSSVAETAWQNVDTAGGRLAVAADATVEADPERLAELFENLFRNALEHGRGSGSGGSRADAAADGEETLTVTVDASPSGFSVADDGIGIPAERRESVFEEGYTTGGSGTGFGLAIVRDIAEAHGWSVALGDGNGGARFEFEAPVADGARPVSAGADEP